MMRVCLPEEFEKVLRERMKNEGLLLVSFTDNKPCKNFGVRGCAVNNTKDNAFVIFSYSQLNDVNEIVAKIKRELYVNEVQQKVIELHRNYCGDLSFVMRGLKDRGVCTEERKVDEDISMGDILRMATEVRIPLQDGHNTYTMCAILRHFKMN